MSKKSIIIIIAVIVVAGVVYLTSRSSNPGQTSMSIAEQNDIDKATVDWNEYTNQLLRYKLLYPKELKAELSDSNNIGFFEDVPTTKITGPAYSIFLYPITTEPYTDFESALIASKKFDIRRKGEPEPLKRQNAGGWNVSENEDITIGGVSSIVQYSDDEGGSYVNVFVPLSNTQYLVIHGVKNSLNQDQNKDIYFDSLFNKMLKTFQLLNK